MKKAQYEVIGLLMIVILISLGVLFVIQFQIGAEQSDLKVSHVEAEFASSFLNAFIETTAEDCYDQQIKSLIHDFVSAGHENYGSQVQCNNLGYPLPSFLYVNKTVYQLLSPTLLKQNRAFRFYISWDSGDLSYLEVSKNYEKCALSRRIESKRLTLPVEGKDINIYLELCE